MSKAEVKNSKIVYWPRNGKWQQDDVRLIDIEGLQPELEKKLLRLGYKTIWDIRVYGWEKLAKKDLDELESLIGPLARTAEETAAKEDAEQFRINPNPSGILPTEFRVLVKPDPAEEKTKGGIIIPDETKERQQFATQKATLVAVSPAAFSYDEDIRKNAPKPGDRVLVAKYSGFEVEGADGVKYKVLSDKDICAVLV